MASSSAFIVSLIINLCIALVVLFLFTLLRRKHPRVYAPRAAIPHLVQRVPPALPPTALGWLGVINFTDDTFFAHAGLDALMIILFFKAFLKTFLFTACFSVVMMIVNATAPCPGISVRPDGSCAISGIDVISLSNIADRSDRMWANALFSYFMFIMGLYQLYLAYQKWARYRARLFRENPLYSTSVYVQDIPPNVRAPEPLRNRYENLYDDVDHVLVAQEADELHATLAEREAVVARLERVRYDNEHDEKKRRATMRKGKIPCVGPKVDAQDELSDQLEALNSKVSELQETARREPVFLPTGIVAFRGRSSVMVALQTNQSAQPFTYITSPCLYDKDVYWPNMDKTFSSRQLRHVLAVVATILLVLFWAIPVTFVASLTTLEKLSAQPGLGWILDIVTLSVVLKGFLEGFLPTLALLIFMAVLPMICRALSAAEGRVSLTEIYISCMRKLFSFYIINVFLVSIVAGAIFDKLNEFTSISSVFTLLGQSIPTTGTFFTNYIMIRSLSIFPLQLLRLGPLIVGYIKKRWLSKTRREIAAVENPGPLPYDYALPIDMLMVLLGFTYSTVTPLVVPFVVVYFGLGFITYAYLLMYVNVPIVEGGGLAWPTMFNLAMLGIFVAELSLTAIVAIKQAIGPAILLVPLLVGTLFFWSHLHSRFKNRGKYYPWDLCKRVNSHTTNETLAAPLVPPLESTDEVHVAVPFHAPDPLAQNGDAGPLRQPEMIAPAKIAPEDQSQQM